MSYYFWGPRDYSGDIVISIGGNLSFLEARCAAVEKVAAITHEQVVGINTNVPIYLCRGINQSLQENWPDYKHCFNRPS